MCQLVSWNRFLSLAGWVAAALQLAIRPDASSASLRDTQWCLDNDAAVPDRRCYGGPGGLRCEDYFQQAAIDSVSGGTRDTRTLGCTWTDLADNGIWSSSCVVPWPSTRVPKTSSIVVGSKDTVPSPEKWARCQYCGLEGFVPEAGPVPVLRTVLFDPGGSPSLQSQLGEEAVLSQSKWESFFHNGSQHTNPGSLIQARLLGRPFSPEQCARYVDRPTFVFHLLTWQVGHLLVDVLEPLFSMMQEELGSDFSSTLLILDIASAEERTVIHEKLVQTVYDTDTPFQLLRRFTASPIHLTSSIASLPGVTCFRSLHVGLDISRTYYSQGYDQHPYWLDLSTLGGHALRSRYQLFQQFLSDGLDSQTPAPLPPAPGPVWTAIRRSGQRQLQNHRQVVSALAQAFPTVQVQEAVLEDMTFTQQVAQLRRSEVLIGQYGTGLHNVCFMRPGSAVVLLMPPLWCPWAWQMANQAVASGVHVVVFCQEVLPTPSVRRWHRVRWSKQGWMQGPWHTKYAQQTVDARTIIRLAGMARDLAASKQTAGVHHVEVSYSKFTALSDAVPDGDPVRVWAHFGNVSLEAVDAGRVLRLVPEVLVNQHPAHVFSEHSLLFCAEVNSSNEQCFLAADFNEFSTLNVNLPPWHTQGDEPVEQYVVRGWVIEETSGQVLDGSETLLVLMIRDGQYTHVAPAAFPRQPVGYEPRTLRIPIELNGSVRTQLVVDLEDDLGIQRQPALFSREHDLSLEARSQIAVAVQRLALAELVSAQLGLPRVQHMPSPARPFVFLHLEKCGGSSARKLIVEGALNSNLSFFAPGFTENGYNPDPDQCVRFNLSWVPEQARARLEVVALHPSRGWDIWQDLPSAAAAESEQRHCFVLLRDPLERAISMYYQRIWNIHTTRRLNELGVEELEQLMTNAYGVSKPSESAHLPNQGSIYMDEGMSDAACKMLCSANTHHGKLVTDVRPAAKAYSYDVAEQRLSECVVGVLDKWNDSKSVMTRWFPWMHFNDSVRMNPSWWAKDKEKPAIIQPHVRATLLKHNKCDTQLYAYAGLLFEEQLKVLAMTR